jgi:hypothetical protein
MLGCSWIDFLIAVPAQRPSRRHAAPTAVRLLYNAQLFRSLACTLAVLLFAA